MELLIPGSGAWVTLSRFRKVVSRGVATSAGVGAWELIILESGTRSSNEISAMLRDLTTLGGGACWFNEIFPKLRKLLSQGAGSSGGV